MTDKERLGYYLMYSLVVLFVIIATTLLREKINNLESRIKTLETFSPCDTLEIVGEFENQLEGSCDNLNWVTVPDTTKVPYYRIKIVPAKTEKK